LKLDIQLGAILDYKLGSNSRHYLSRKWACHIVFCHFRTWTLNF
jgi:hypothetical protein